jgi:hypothetical protein
MSACGSSEQERIEIVANSLAYLLALLSFPCTLCSIGEIRQEHLQWGCLYSFCGSKDMKTYGLFLNVHSAEALTYTHWNMSRNRF